MKQDTKYKETVEDIIATSGMLKFILTSLSSQLSCGNCPFSSYLPLPFINTKRVFHIPQSTTIGFHRVSSKLYPRKAPLILKLLTFNGLFQPISVKVFIFTFHKATMCFSIAFMKRAYSAHFLSFYKSISVSLLLLLNLFSIFSLL